MGSAVPVSSPAPWAKGLGRVVTLTFVSVNLLVAVLTTLHTPPAAWVTVLPFLVFETVAAGLGLLQTEAKRYATRAIEIVVPVVGTWLFPVAYDLLHAQEHIGVFAPAWAVITVLSYLWLLWSVATLGRNFSILPEARTLVARGPYAVTGHPMYLGYGVLWGLAAVFTGSLWVFALWAVSCALLVWRARLEERTLGLGFGEGQTLDLEMHGEVLGRIRVARSFRSRMHGLLGRNSLPDGEGILLVPCRSIHMRGMRFAIDCVFLDRQGRAARILRSFAPGRSMLWPAWSAYMAVELPAGAASKIQQGDRLTLTVSS